MTTHAIQTSSATLDSFRKCVLSIRVLLEVVYKSSTLQFKKLVIDSLKVKPHLCKKELPLLLYLEDYV